MRTPNLRRRIENKRRPSLVLAGVPIAYHDLVLATHNDSDRYPFAGSLLHRPVLFQHYSATIEFKNRSSVTLRFEQAIVHTRPRDRRCVVIDVPLIEGTIDYWDFIRHRPPPKKVRDLLMKAMAE